MKTSPSALPGAAATLSPCAASPSDEIAPLPASAVAKCRVSEVAVKSLPQNVAPKFNGMLTAALKRQTQSCAKGAVPLRLEANVVEFHAQDPGETFAAGDSDSIRGSVQFIDPVTNKIVGDYDIARSDGWFGLIGMAILSDAEGRMTETFAKERCDRAYPNKS